MIGSAGIVWKEAVFRSSDYLRYDVRQLGDADRRAMLVLGPLVIVGAACFIALGSKRLRMTAGGLVVIAASAGLVIALGGDSPSLAGLGLPCTNAPRPTCLTDINGGNGRALAGWGAGLAAGFGILALLRSGGEASATPTTERPGGDHSAAGRTGPATKPRRAPMSDASLLGWTVLAIVIALVVGFSLVVWSICSDPTEWC